MTGMVRPPERVLLRHGSVYTPECPAATAMLSVGERVVWVGTDEAAKPYVDSADLVVDLNGRLVTPGFVDAHVHLALTGLALATLDLSLSNSLAEALRDLKAYAATAGDTVVFAHGWDESGWPEGRAPTTAELDTVVGDRVAFVSRVDGHSAVVSSALLAVDRSIAGIDGWRADGLVERDAHHAARAVTSQLWNPAERSGALLRALRHAASQGITSVHELNAPHISAFEDFAALRQLSDAEPLLPDVVPYWGEFQGGDADDPTLLGFAGDLCVDGAIGSRTACLHEGYADADTSGHLYLESDDVSQHIVYCTQRGIQAGFHVIGDRAMDEVIGGMRQAADLLGAEAMIAARHRLEHVEMPTGEAISTLADLGVVASVQPAFDAAWGGGGALYERRLGASRAATMNPFASMRAAGVVLAFGSDSPVTPLAPWTGVQAAVFHSNVDERLSVSTAFDAATRGGHRACRRDNAGVLAPGAEATYAIWDVDAPGLPDLVPDRPLPRCARSVVAGRTIFCAEGDS